VRTFKIHATVEANTLDGAIAALLTMLETTKKGAGERDTSGVVTQCTIEKRGAWTFLGGANTATTIMVEQ
jgi:hypothetical protein